MRTTLDLPMDLVDEARDALGFKSRRTRSFWPCVSWFAADGWTS
jgi:hypothetical protein